MNNYNLIKKVSELNETLLNNRESYVIYHGPTEYKERESPKEVAGRGGGGGNSRRILKSSSFHDYIGL